ncbi:S-adenosyl-L-methionine-dependent methyltransferase, partial [Corynespora cassiicola Philippines]
MSLYYEAAALLANPDNAGGSLKSRVFRKKDLKSSPAQLFALVAEASKWSPVLKDVIEKCALWPEEKKLTPVLALLLTHDLLLSKGGVAAPANHVLKLAINRHKARLSAEFTKARVRRGCASIQDFKAVVESGALHGEQHAPRKHAQHPRWVRVNTLKTTLEHQLATTFAEYQRADKLDHILYAPAASKLYFEDEHIPNLLAFPSRVDLSKTKAYLGGEIIFQDKASCFPAYLLHVTPDDGDSIDGCAAPGNKTTHLAAIVSAQQSGTRQKVIAFERDKIRTGTLTKMVKLASADGIVSIKGDSDFLAANPAAEEFARVGAILLDPSCSGSGIVGRDDAITMHLPDPHVGARPSANATKSKKRKRGNDTDSTSAAAKTLDLTMDDAAQEETPMDGKLAERLAALSTFQLRILLHAMRFPNARKITYSTCSIHFEENEGVVFQALASKVAKEQGWTVLKRERQVDGLKKWKRRGVWEDEKLVASAEVHGAEKTDVLDACIRCEKDTDEGTMGFFVAAFVRNENAGSLDTAKERPILDNEEDEWQGFGDNGVEASATTKANIPAVATDKQKKKKRKGNGKLS